MIRVPPCPLPYNFGSGFSCDRFFNVFELADDSAICRCLKKFSNCFDLRSHGACRKLALRLRMKPIIERERFHSLVAHAFKQAGAQHTLLFDSGLELLRQASRGLPRYAGRILKTSLQLAVPKGLNHLPDELTQQAIEELL